MDKKALFLKCVSFTTAVHRMTHELAKDAKPNSITPIQYHILEYIAVNQPVTPSEISDCQNLSLPNTSRELRKLSEKGIIEKFSVSEDRRKQYVRLSKDGEALMEKAFFSVESHFLQRLQNASDCDIEDINHALDILQTKLFY